MNREPASEHVLTRLVTEMGRLRPGQLFVAWSYISGEAQDVLSMCLWNRPGNPGECYIGFLDDRGRLRNLCYSTRGRVNVFVELPCPMRETP